MNLTMANGDESVKNKLEKNHGVNNIILYIQVMVIYKKQQQMMQLNIVNASSKFKMTQVRCNITTKKT